MSNALKKKFRDEDFILYRLPAVARKMSLLCAHEYFAEFKMKVPEWRLLAQVGRFDQISAKELSDKMAMDPVAISRALQKCVARRLVREIVNPRDRRSKVLTLTSAGEAFLDRFYPHACALAVRMENGLTAKEVKQLKTLVGKLDGHLKTLAPPPVRAKRRANGN